MQSAWRERCSGWNIVSAIFAVGTASLAHVDEVETGLDVTMIQIVGGQQAVPLRSDVAERHHHVGSNLLLYLEVVLLGVLRSQVRFELAIHDDGPKSRPVDGLAGFRLEETIEGIRRDGARLAHEWSLKQRRKQAVTAAEGRLALELLEDKLLHGIVKNAETGADDKLSLPSFRAPRNPDPGRKCLVVGCREAGRNAFVSGHDQAEGKHGFVL